MFMFCDTVLLYLEVILTGVVVSICGAKAESLRDRTPASRHVPLGILPLGLLPLGLLPHGLLPPSGRRCSVSRVAGS